MFADIARKEGEIGAFYNVLRNFNQRKIVERIFVTGVLPVTMDTAVSGFVSSSRYHGYRGFRLCIFKAFSKTGS